MRTVDTGMKLQMCRVSAGATGFGHHVNDKTDAAAD
jgi:hypothetical protein